MADETQIRNLSGRDIVYISAIGLTTIFLITVFGGLEKWIGFLAAAGFFLALAVYGFSGAGADRLSRSDAKRASEQRILEEQSRLADGFTEAVVIIDSYGYILHANPIARDMFALRYMGGSLSKLVNNPDILNHVETALAGGNPDPVTYHLSTPTERHIRVMASTIDPADSPEKARRAIIVFYDITDVVRVNTMRADFLANASHELKTPVASLLGYIETLRGHAKDDPKAQETFLGIMQQQAERMQRLINDLLSLRRIEIVEHILPAETGDLFLATRAAIEAVKPMADKRHVEIKYAGPEEVPVIGIQDELVQLVLNLLDNAVLFTPPTLAVSLTLTQADNWSSDMARSRRLELKRAPMRKIAGLAQDGHAHAILRITDRGPGFAQEHLPRLGERFYKVGENDPKGPKRGTGLGLAIVKHIVRRHRGALYVQSQQGTGTEFTIVLPLQADS
jgi:two-component system phosphate regulon sensor histidine kinase PhoR